MCTPKCESNKLSFHSLEGGSSFSHKNVWNKLERTKSKQFDEGEQKIMKNGNPKVFETKIPENCFCLKFLRISRNFGKANFLFFEENKIE